MKEREYRERKVEEGECEREGDGGERVCEREDRGERGERDCVGSL